MADFSKGLYTDCNEQDQPSGTYRFAKNMVDANTLGALENELGFANLGDIGVPGTVIGQISMGNSAAVFSVEGTNSYIGYVTQQANKTLVYTNVITSTELDFSTSFPIKGEFQINAKGDRIVAWIDKLNIPRILNLDDPNISDISDYDVFATSSNPFWTVTSSNTGGSLKTASYIPIFKYTDSSGRESSWVVTGSVIRIVDDPIATSISFDGSPADVATTKSITISLTSNDVSYDTILYGLIEMKGGTITAYQVQETNLSSSSSYTYTGNESRIDLSLDEVLTTSAYVVGANAITQLNNQLILGNLTYDEQLDLQAIANKITINYTTSPASSVSYTVDQVKGFQSGEVYAFYLVIELRSGGYVSYHIPGRGPTASERNNSSFVNGLSSKVFRVENTADTASAITNMGFWENENETYDADFPVGYTWNGADDVLANQKVRHHRFPELETQLTTGSTYGTTTYTRLGINVGNVLIPSDVQAKIKGWRIGYAKRTYENSTVLGGDLLNFSYRFENSSVGVVDDLWSTTGGNWRAGLHQPGTLSTSLHRGHSLDLLFDKPGVVPGYLKFIYKLRRTSLNTTYTGFGGAGSILIGNENVFQINYATLQATRTLITSGTRAVSLSQFQYIPQNTTVNTGTDDVTTLNTEEIIHAKLSTFDSAGLGYYSETGGTISLLSASGGFDTAGAENDEAQSYFVQYRQAPLNVYNSFKNQEVVVLDKRANPATTSLASIYGGDTFVTLMTYSTNVPYTNAALQPAVTFFNCFLGEARHNWKLRYEDGSLDSKFFPKSDLSDFLDSSNHIIITANSDKNRLNYNTDYDLVNEFTPSVVIDDVDDFVTTAPTTIIYSAEGSLESVETNWRFFPLNNRYVQPRNKGAITNLQGINNSELIIHHENTIYTTRSEVSLATNEGEDVNIKSTNLFSLPPREILSTEGGYAGTQHPLACKITKLGYVFPDAKQGKVFIYDQQLKEISSVGMRAFFRDNLANATSGDNSFTSSGYVMIYDEYYNRLLLTKKDGDFSFTISYNPIQNHWVSYHDYFLPTAIVFSDSSLYTVEGDTWYRFNAGNRGQYFGVTVNPAYVDVVHNDNKDDDKVFSEIRWDSKVYNSVGAIQWNETLTSLTARSLDKCIGKVALDRVTALPFYDSQNIRNYNQSWYFNSIYNVATDAEFLLGFYDSYDLDPTKISSTLPWYSKRKFIDKYLVTRLEHSNLNNRKLLLFGSEAIYRPSYR